MAEKTETQVPKKKGFWKKFGRFTLLTLGAVGVGYGFVKLEQKTGFVTKSETACKNGVKNVKGKIEARRNKPQTVETPQYTETRPQNNNGYQQKNNWQPRENGRPDNRPTN